MREAGRLDMTDVFETADIALIGVERELRNTLIRLPRLHGGGECLVLRHTEIGGPEVTPVTHPEVLIQNVFRRLTDVAREVRDVVIV